jgi:predicted dehydrogenase
VIAETALRRGVPVFVEKPPTVHTEQLQTLAAMASSAEVPSAVGMNFRFALPYLQLKQLLRDPRCGAPIAFAIRHVASKPRQPLWGLSLLRSFLLAQAIHPVDLLVDLAGRPSRISCLRRTTDDGVLVSAQFEFAGGAVGTLITGTYAPRFHTSIEVVTDKGVTLSLVGLSHLTIAGLRSTTAAPPMPGWSQHWRPSPLDTGYERTGFLGELAAFLEAVRLRRRFHPDLKDLLRTYEILDDLEGT